MGQKRIPYGKIESAAELGSLVRGKRKQIKRTQASMAGLSGVGARFMSELERGKPTVELERSLQVLGRLGLDVWVVPRGWTPPGDPHEQ